MDLVDSHCHIQSIGAFGGEEATRSLWEKAIVVDPDAVIERAHKADVNNLICVGCTLDDSRLATEFVKNRENCWASVGLHPHEAQYYPDTNETKQRLIALARRTKVVAIGECGLDYFYEHSDRDSQLRIFELQLEVALEVDLPLIFHVREAFADFWPVFERYTSNERPLRGVVHSFTDTHANVERALKYGLYIGVNGIATFTKHAAQKEVYRTIPLTSLLLETDAPFLTPAPYRGKICEPSHIRTIAEFLANVRGESLGEVATMTTNNARQLFGVSGHGL
jgi:TatD DNase family protein